MTKTIFTCQSCGAKAPKWMGRCATCGEWDSLVEERAAPPDKDKKGRALFTGRPPTPLPEVSQEEASRVVTSFSEFNHILGGGIVTGSLSLVGGDPGIGKSTLLLQIAGALAQKGQRVLYVTAEESASQLKLRADRLGISDGSIFVHAENNLEEVLAQIGKLKPSAAIIDSIQTVYLPDLTSAPGSVGQVRECALQLLRLCKTLPVSVFLIGHVTKDGSIAGPRVLEHMVDTVLYFEGEKNGVYRTLRVIKNRFGPAGEIAVFEMRETGLAEILHPSSVFLSERADQSVGSVVAVAKEGTRPLLVEVQSLVTRSNFGYPQRTCAGIDPKRLTLICAVLERVADYPLGNFDIFLNVPGGVHIDEPAADLAVALSIVSSLLNKPVGKGVCAIGEVGLNGHIRSASDLALRVREAQRLGFNRLLVPGRESESDGDGFIKVERLDQAVKALFN